MTNRNDGCLTFFKDIQWGQFVSEKLRHVCVCVVSMIKIGFNAKTNDRNKYIQDSG